MEYITAETNCELFVDVMHLIEEYKQVKFTNNPVYNSKKECFEEIPSV